MILQMHSEAINPVRLLLPMLRVNSDLFSFKATVSFYRPLTPKLQPNILSVVKIQLALEINGAIPFSIKAAFKLWFLIKPL